MSDLPDEVMNRAVEAARSAYAYGVTRYTTIKGGREDNTEWVESLQWKDAIREAAPVLMEAERERIKARIEKYAEMEEEIAEDYTSPDYGRGIVAGYRAALSVIDEEGPVLRYKEPGKYKAEIVHYNGEDCDG